MKSIAIAAAAGLLVVTAACGDDSASGGDDTSSQSAETGEDTGEDTGEEGGYPPCSEIWVDGETLPEDYGGCTQDDASLAGSSWVDCRDGSKLFTHDDVAFYTLADRTIVATDGQSSDDPGYQERSAAC